MQDTLGDGAETQGTMSPRDSMRRRKWPRKSMPRRPSQIPGDFDDKLGAQLRITLSGLCCCYSLRIETVTVCTSLALILCALLQPIL